MSAEVINQAAVIPELATQLPPDSTLVLRGVSWEDYEELLEAVGEARGLRISYDQGTLQIMTLGTEHENIADLIQDLVRLLSLRLQIKVLSFGSATMKKRGKRKGLESDGCFYVQTAAAIGKKLRLDFESDPPPDIALEVDLHHESLSKFPIYVAISIPEIWRYDGQSLIIYHLQGGQYLPAETSLALPMLTSKTLTDFLARSQYEDQYDILLAFDKWLKDQKV
jgi:Uma2 family endonuclease